MRDDYRQKHRRATKLRFASVLDRFLNDATDDYWFRKNMLHAGWTEQTISIIDEVATAPAKPAPKRGQGRTREQRAQYEGYYDRVDIPGGQPERPLEEREVPEYQHQRIARTRAETMRWTYGTEPPRGKGSSGYSRAKGGHRGWTAGPWQAGWAATGTWWTTAASSWSQAESTRSSEEDGFNIPEATLPSWLLTTLFVFAIIGIVSTILRVNTWANEPNKPNAERRTDSTSSSSSYPSRAATGRPEPARPSIRRLLRNPPGRRHQSRRESSRDTRATRRRRTTTTSS
jgi:hypothetical protein